MTPEQILAEPPRVLTQNQRESYFERGYVTVESLISDKTIKRLNEVTNDFVEQSRSITRSGADYDVADDHSADSPKIRRLKMPDRLHEDYWGFATGLIADVAADLVGPDVVFHHSKLNFKWDAGSDDVKWHQDIQFYPHTNYSPLTIGTYLADTGMDDGPLMVVSGSHNGPLFDQYDEDGSWVGCLSAEDASTVDTGSVDYLTGPAGSITVHNCRTVHGSPPTGRPSGRPLLLNAYASADAFPYTAHPQPTANTGKVIRGQPARWAHHDPRPCLIPPDWSGGYDSIFAAQDEEG
ncbi:MAG: phytanoyl-CoA dioxygenase family protein [bacterium]|nr:phytanoyl-CoA dioxygenase family protein [bacterium]MDE0287441.1 phytanoyl-CoA dioxygenase family protein [bacterium]MDE0436862.1 phytanoyl-CoA dioxygenase family protein [bacterium]